MGQIMKLTLLFWVVLLWQVGVQGASITLNIDSGDKSLRGSSGILLSGGSPAVDHDGTLVLLGYFPGATLSAPFGAGTDNFVALLGRGTPFGMDITIGDSASNGGSNGEIFGVSVNIQTGIADQLFPSNGTPLVLRVFDRNQPTIGSHFMDLSNSQGSWNWKPPAVPAATINLDMSVPGLVTRATEALNGPFNPNPTPVTGTEIRTLHTVTPEPASTFLALFGGALLLARRRHRSAESPDRNRRRVACPKR